jgi:hypothetical protein
MVRVSVEEARREAKIKLAEVARGEDPSEARKVARDACTVADYATVICRMLGQVGPCIVAVGRRQARLKSMRAAFGATSRYS